MAVTARSYSGYRVRSSNMISPHATPKTLRSHSAETVPCTSGTVSACSRPTSSAFCVCGSARRRKTCLTSSTGSRSSVKLASASPRLSGRIAWWSCAVPVRWTGMPKPAGRRIETNWVPGAATKVYRPSRSVATVVTPSVIPTPATPRAPARTWPRIRVKVPRATSRVNPTSPYGSASSASGTVRAAVREPVARRKERRSMATIYLAAATNGSPFHGEINASA